MHMFPFFGFDGRSDEGWNYFRAIARRILLERMTKLRVSIQHRKYS